MEIKTEEKHLDILENIGVAYFELDLKGNMTNFNDVVSRKLGYSREELLGMNYRVYSRPEDLKYVKSVYSDIYRTGKPKSMIDIIVIAKDGSQIMVEQSISLKRSSSGEPVGFHTVARDITERILVEHALMENEEKYRTILDSMEEGLFEDDLEGNFTYVNDAACRLLGYERSEMIGMNYRRLFSPDAAKSVYTIYNEIYNTGEPKFLVDYEVLRKDGSARIHQANAVLLKDSSGKPTGFRILARDVTEARQSEKKYQTILETMDEGYFEVDLNGVLTFVNDAACRIMGYKREELIGKSYKNIHTAEVAKYLRDIYIKIYNTGKPEFLVNNEIVHSDGSVRIHQSNIALVRDPSGKPAGFSLLVRDITEQKKSEEALRQSEVKYRTVIETMEEGYFQVDLEGRITFVNEAACRMMGYDRDELTGASYQKIHAPEVARNLKTIFHQIYETGNPEFMLLHDVICKDGSKRIHQSNAALIRDFTGKPTGFSIFVQDVTEQKKAEEALRQSEEKYRMIAENVYDVIWITDLDLKSIYVSPSVFKITGFSPQEFQDKPINEVVTPASFDVIMKIFSEELAREKSGNAGPDKPKTIELELVRKDGSPVCVEISADFIRNETGQANGILGVIRDISERKNSEKEKSRLEEQLSQAQKMESVGRLAGGVAHDFNNMLSVILGYAELIKLNLPEGNPLSADVAEIEKAATRSRDITRQLLAFSRKQIISPVTVELNGLIRGVQNTLFRLIGEDIDLKFSPRDDVCNIKFDPAQMEQVLINLAVNARDAMQNGGRLSIETRKTYLDDTYCKAHPEFSPGHYVLMTVSDDGAGMSKETLQHVFEPFFTTKETGRGTGLGLATVYGIVRQNNGLINVYSEPGKGTSFMIYIPRSMDEGEMLQKDEEEAVLSGSGTILLVEDDDMVRKMSTEMLEKIGYTVLPTGDPPQALRLCEDDNVHIDLLMTDVVMPGMSGKDLRDRIVARRPEIRVLFMSGYTSNIIVNRGVLEEGVHFIQKPFTMGDLARNVRNSIASGKS